MPVVDVFSTEGFEDFTFGGLIGFEILAEIWVFGIFRFGCFSTFVAVFLSTKWADSYSIPSDGLGGSVPFLFDANPEPLSELFSYKEKEFFLDDVYLFETDRFSLDRAS